MARLFILFTAYIFDIIDYFKHRVSQLFSDATIFVAILARFWRDSRTLQCHKG
jgi:hypothetical protein